MINGSDYNVTIKTPHFLMKPMTSADKDLLAALCEKKGFTYPYIHKNPKFEGLSMSERAYKYTQIGDACAAGEEGRSLVQSVFTPEGKFIGAAVLYEVSPESTLFGNVKEGKAWEIGSFIDPDYQGKLVATETLYHIVKYGVENWGLTQIHASMEPGREGSVHLSNNFGMDFVEYIEPGALLESGERRVPYNDDEGKPAARIIYRTPEEWDFWTSLKFKPQVIKAITASP